MSTDPLPEVASYTIDDQLTGTGTPQVCELANGGFVVAWGAAVSSILVQVFDAAGDKVGAIQHVDPPPGRSFGSFRLGAADDGYALAYTTSDFDGSDVRLSLFMATGAAAGGFVADVDGGVSSNEGGGYTGIDFTAMAGQQYAVSVAYSIPDFNLGDPSEPGVAAGVDARIFAADGTPVGASRPLASNASDLFASAASTVSSLDGEYMALTVVRGDDEFGVRGYDLSAHAGGTTTANTDLRSLFADGGAGLALSPQNATATLAGGGFAVAWLESINDLFVDDTSYTAIGYGVLTASGAVVKLGSDTFAYDPGIEAPEVVALSNGAFAVGWQASDGFKLQFVGADGTGLGVIQTLQPGFDVTDLSVIDGVDLMLSGVDAAGDVRTVRFDTPDNVPILGDGTANLFQGTNAADSIFGLGGDDELHGGDGNDEIYGGDGADTIVGDNGDDRIFGEAGDDTLNGAYGNNYLDGGDGNDRISGGAGDDVIFGGAGNDRISGATGNDVIDGGAGNDVMIGGDGIDTVSYDDAAAGVTVSLAITIAQNTGGGGIDTLTEFENLRGSAFNDVLTGSAGANQIFGGAGNDRIDGGAGDDVIEGGAGNDVLIGGDGIDTVSYGGALAGVSVNLALTAAQNTGGDGIDTLTGFENLRGSAFNDGLVGSAGANQIFGGAGDDTIDGGAGDDRLFGEAGDDGFRWGAGADAYDGGAGMDVVNYGLSAGVNAFLDGSGTNGHAALGDTFVDIENLVGSATGPDFLVGNAGANRLVGQGGDDILWGREGDDLLEGGDGDDRLVGQQGNDVLVGGAGADTFAFTLAPADGGLDRTNDFVAGTDKIEIDASMFGGGLVAGGPAPLVTGANPSSAGFASGVFLYNTLNGFLSWDADGQGAGAAVSFFRLQNLPSLTAADFSVVA